MVVFPNNIFTLDTTERKAASASKSVKKDNVSGASKLFKIAHHRPHGRPEAVAIRLNSSWG
jgi:hypothetical protein